MFFIFSNFETFQKIIIEHVTSLRSKRTKRHFSSSSFAINRNVVVVHIQLLLSEKNTIILDILNLYMLFRVKPIEICEDRDRFVFLVLRGHTEN